MARTFKHAVVITPEEEAVSAIEKEVGELHVSVFTAFHKETLRGEPCDFLFIDLALFDATCESHEREAYRRAFSDLRMEVLDAPVVVLVKAGQEPQALAALKAGAEDFLYYPISSQKLIICLDGLNEFLLLAAEVSYHRGKMVAIEPPDFFKTNNCIMGKVYGQAKRVARTTSTVLITGETGTGKTLLARQIHELSDRRDAPFISIHCGAIPESLLESELFGHEKGAFTGAVRQKLGPFDIARGGTVFLDEIGAVPLAMQVKLLQVLQDQTFTRVGGEKLLKADVRVIAATNDDLLAMSREGTFRQDLYYRLNVFPIYLPTLRERIEDLPLINEVLLLGLKKRLSINIDSIHPCVLDAFAVYDWPGNIRELENILERALILEDTKTLMPDSFPANIFSNTNSDMLIAHFAGTLGDARQRMIDHFEQRYVAQLLATYRGKVTAAAQHAGVGVRQMNKLIKKYSLCRGD